MFDHNKSNQAIFYTPRDQNMYIHNILAQNISTKAQRIELYYIIQFPFGKVGAFLGSLFLFTFCCRALVGGF